MIGHELPPGVFDHPELAGRRWTLTRRIAGRHTDLLEFLDGSRGDRIFVKRQHAAPGGKTDCRLRREFRALRVLQWRLAPEMARSLPAPIRAHQNDSILVLRGVDGVPLSRVLKRDANLLTGWSRRSRLAGTGTAVGNWLRYFHSATSRAPLSHDHQRFCQNLDAAFQRLARKVGSAGLGELNERLTQTSRRLSGVPLLAAARHGDFLPQNILVSPAGIGVVDFENYRRLETVHRDFGYMLAYIMMLGRRPGYLPAALHAFSTAFETAYGGDPRTDVQRLFSAEGAVRIARDSANPRTARAMLKTVAALMSPGEQSRKHRWHD